MPTDKAMITLRVDPAIRDEMTAEAKRLGMSRARWTEMVIREALEKARKKRR
jgi:predicted HicB family RNase H-like nuclease